MVLYLGYGYVSKPVDMGRKLGQQKTGKTLSLKSLDSCCSIQIVGSEFGINNTRAVFKYQW